MSRAMEMFSKFSYSCAVEVIVVFIKSTAIQRVRISIFLREQGDEKNDEDRITPLFLLTFGGIACKVQKASSDFSTQEQPRKETLLLTDTI
jgi:hypothetical protein